MAKITTITNPLTGQPAQVDQLDHTAQEIDDAIARALPSGAIDIALQKKADGYREYYPYVGGAVGWYRICVGDEYSRAMISLTHEYATGGPSNLLLDADADSYSNELTCFIYKGNGALEPLITNARIVNLANNQRAIDVYYGTGSGANGWEVGIVNLGRTDFEIQTPTFVSANDTLPSGETLLCPMEWLNPLMLLGEEYRTTERYQGKPVYTKLLSGVMLDQNKRLNIPHGISNLQCIFDARGNLNNAVIPAYAPVSDYTTTAYGVHVWTGTASVFVASTGYSYTGDTVYVQIKYIKTTD